MGFEPIYGWKRTNIANWPITILASFLSRPLRSTKASKQAVTEKSAELHALTSPSRARGLCRSGESNSGTSTYTVGALPLMLLRQRTLRELNSCSFFVREILFHWVKHPFQDDWSRTNTLLHPKQILYQLSYILWVYPQRDLNLRSFPFQGNAVTTELWG